MKSCYFDDVTLLITHYNRVDSLKNLLSKIKLLHLSFHEIIVSDDGSNESVLEKLNALQLIFSFKLITSLGNRGLGNNINKGQDAVKTPYTLYVQEDFIPTDLFCENFINGYNLLKQSDDLDIIRFYAFYSYPYLKPYRCGYSEMVFRKWGLNHLKFYYYSDHPHLRRSNFFEKFGRYKEGVKGDITEFNMCLSFLKKGGKGLFFNDFSSLFHHNNTEEEPSTMLRVRWRHKKNYFILFLRSVYLKYRIIKNTIQLYQTNK